MNGVGLVAMIPIHVEEPARVLGIRCGRTGSAPKVRFWGKYRGSRFESTAVFKGTTLEVRVGKKTVWRRAFKSSAAASSHFHWAEHQAMRWLWRYVVATMKTARAEQLASGALPAPPRPGITYYTKGTRGVVLIVAPNGLHRISGDNRYGGLTHLVQTRKLKASTDFIARAGKRLLADGFKLTKPTAQLRKAIALRVKIVMDDAARLG
jgi:hypothetical protein